MKRVLAHGMIMSFLRLNLLFVGAHPIGEAIHTIRDELPPVALGEHSNHRTIVVIFCMSYAFLLALAQGYRAGRMTGHKTGVKFSDILVFAQGFISTAFVFAVGINSAGLGLSTDAQCYAAIRVCIAMYGAAKIALYLFLLERVHIVRTPFIDRVRDPIWALGTVITVGGFAAIIGYEFVAPRAELSRMDGICRIGINPDSGIAVIALDTTINVALTSIFFWQLRPILGSLVLWPSSRTPNGPTNQTKRSFLYLFKRKRDEQEAFTTQATSHRNLIVMLTRNVVGSSLLLCATVANNAIFLTWPFASFSHACQLMCLTDIVLGMLVTNWLTIRSTTQSVGAHKKSSSTFGGSSAATCRSRWEISRQDTELSTAVIAKPDTTTNVTPTT